MNEMFMIIVKIFSNTNVISIVYINPIWINGFLYNISSMHAYAFYQKWSRKHLIPNYFRWLFTFLPQNTRSNIIYAHTDHALILADFRCSFEWIWNNTIKKNDVNFLREKREARKYVYEYIQKPHTLLLLLYFSFNSWFNWFLDALTHGYTQQHTYNKSIH